MFIQIHKTKGQASWLYVTLGSVIIMLSVSSCGGGSNTNEPVGQQNAAPTANAGSDQNAIEGDVVNLDGSMSADVDGSIVSFRWEQLSGPDADINNINDAVLSFQAPETQSNSELEFELSVSDNLGATATDRVVVRITGANTRVLTTEGFIEGELVGTNIHAFRGVPFAVAPIGNLRWRPPVPLSQRSETLITQQFAPACFQPADATVTSFSPSDNMSEDCLYLNIWSSNPNPSDSMAVMLWIHGGSNLTGSASQPIYDGQFFAQQDVVLVSIQYRLGVMGYLAHPELSAELDDKVSGGASGNYGLHDILAALKWVQMNIAQFGGDPNRITIFGESAGAVNACAMLVSPLASGLFDNVIMQSGFCANQMTDIRQSQSEFLVSAEQQGKQASEVLGCQSETSETDCMRALSAEHIYETLDPGGQFFEQDKPRFGIITDGLVLLEPPFKTLNDNQANTANVIIGSNSNEAGLWRLQINQLISSIAAYRRVLESLFDNDEDLVINGDAADVLAAYPASSVQEARTQFERLYTDLLFTCSVRSEVRALSASNQPTWRYEFTYLTPGLEGLGAFHASEIPYVFGTTAEDNSVEGTAVSQNMQQYWVNFAKTGNPNNQEGAEADLLFWPNYETVTDQHIIFNEPLAIDEALRSVNCDLLDSVLD